jgi:formylglycine-generating enzyme required for sulfatase activity
MVLVPQTKPTDPRTFYIMENKVWNDLYAAVIRDPKWEQLVRKYLERAQLEELADADRGTAAALWRKGGRTANGQDVGVEGAEKGLLPVFRVKATEAHCFAERLGGRLPKRDQLLKAAGWDDDPQSGPPQEKEKLAIDQKDGPWSVYRGDRDVGIYGCRQMASNGWEWTRDLSGEKGEIPLRDPTTAYPEVHYLGGSYLDEKPRTLQHLNARQAEKCTKGHPEITFRIVLER